MLLKIAKTGSDGNAFALYSDSGEILLIEAGVDIRTIKKMIDYRIEDVSGLVVSHCHQDHSLSADKIKRMGIPVWQPYLDEEHKRLKALIGGFEIQSFPIPHDGTENRGFLIDIDGQRICYMCDLEYCPWDLSKQNINVLILECNYIMDMVNDDLPQLVHKVKGHLELNTCIDIVNMCQRKLRKVILIHMSKGETMNRERAMTRIRESVPAFIDVEFAKANTTYDLSEVPF